MTRMNGKSILAILLVLTLIMGIILSLYTLSLREQTPLRIASSIWPGYQILFLSDSLGYLANEEILLTETGSATESLALLANGDVDGAALTLDETLQAIDQGQDLTIVLVFDISRGADMIITTPEIDRVEQLRNKRIVVEGAAVGELLLTMALEQHGMSRSDVEVVTLTFDQHLDAWLTGDYDAVVTYEPVASKIKSAGGQVIFDSTQIPDTIIDVLAIRSESIEQKTDSIHRLVTAYFRAQQHFLTNFHDAEYRMSARMGVASHQVAALYQGIQLPTLEYNYRLLHAQNLHLHELAKKIRALQLWPMQSDTDTRQLRYTNRFISLD